MKAKLPPVTVTDAMLQHLDRLWKDGALQKDSLFTAGEQMRQSLQKEFGLTEPQCRYVVLYWTHVTKEKVW